MDQATRCEAIKNAGNTCVNPEIRYGSTEGGIPVKYDFPLDAYCVQLGFSGFVEAQYGSRPCLPPQGMVYWGSGYDEDVEHWTDYDDGFWFNSDLNWHGCGDAMIISITCAS